MARFAVEEDADDFSRRGGAGQEEVAEGFRAKVGLVAEGDDEVGEGGVPHGAARSGDDGAHHAALEGEGGRALAGGDVEAVEFPDDGRGRVGRMDDEDFFRARFVPLGEEMAEDGGAFPRQAQLGRAHPAGFARGKNGDEEGGHRDESTLERRSPPVLSEAEGTVDLFALFPKLLSSAGAWERTCPGSFAALALSIWARRLCLA